MNRYCPLCENTIDGVIIDIKGDEHFLCERRHKSLISKEEAEHEGQEATKHVN